MNDVQRLLQQELPKDASPECQQIHQDLIAAAGEDYDKRVAALTKVKERAVAANCRPAILSSLRALALEFTTQLDQEGLSRTTAEFQKYSQ